MDKPSDISRKRKLIEDDDDATTLQAKQQLMDSSVGKEHILHEDAVVEDLNEEQNVEGLNNTEERVSTAYINVERHEQDLALQVVDDNLGVEQDAEGLKDEDVAEGLDETPQLPVAEEEMEHPSFFGRSATKTPILVFKSSSDEVEDIFVDHKSVQDIPKDSEENVADYKQNIVNSNVIDNDLMEFDSNDATEENVSIQEAKDELPVKDTAVTNQVSEFDSAHVNLHREERQEGELHLGRGDHLQDDDGGLKDGETSAVDETKTCSTLNEPSVTFSHAFILVGDTDPNQIYEDDSILTQLEHNKKQGNSSQENPQDSLSHKAQALIDEKEFIFNDALPEDLNPGGQDAIDDGGFAVDAEGASGGAGGSLIDDRAPKEGAVPGDQDKAALPEGAKEHKDKAEDPFPFKKRAVPRYRNPLPQHLQDPQQIQQITLAANVPSGTSDQKAQLLLQKAPSAEDTKTVAKQNTVSRDRSPTPDDFIDVGTNPPPSTPRDDQVVSTKHSVTSGRRLTKADLDEDDEDASPVKVRAFRRKIRASPRIWRPQVKEITLAANVPSITSDQKAQLVLQKASSAEDTKTVAKKNTRARSTTPDDSIDVGNNTPVLSTSRVDPVARPKHNVTSGRRLAKADLDEDDEKPILANTPSTSHGIPMVPLKQRYSMDVGIVSEEYIFHIDENKFERLVKFFCGKDLKMKKEEENDEEDEETKEDAEDDKDKKKDDDVAEYEVEFIVRKIRKPKDANDRVFVVVWRHWNLSACTIRSLNDLKGAEYNLEEFIRYDQTCTKLINRHNKVRKGIKAQRQKLDLLTDFYGCWLDDEQWKREKGTPANFEKQFELWAWVDKAREWNEVERAFHPGKDHFPLYLEYFHKGAKLPKDFAFISKHYYAASVRQLVDRMNGDRRLPNCECVCSDGICDLCYHNYGDDLEPCSLIKNGIGQIHRGGELSRSFVTVICEAGACKKEVPCCYPCREYSLMVAWRPDVKGLGVYATAAIPQWKVVAEYTGEVITEKEANLVEMNYQFGVPKTNLVIDAKHMGNESRFINHSCEPNCGLLTVYEGGVLAMPKLYIVTLMNVKQGDEILIDYHPSHAYDKTKAAPPNSSKCFCGAKTCRKYV